MIAIKTVDLTQDFKTFADKVIAGERVLVSRPRNENLVVITEKEYNELEKEVARLRHNVEYLSKLERSRQQLAEGKTVTVTMEQLEEMARS